MKRAENKTLRLMQISALLVAHPEGLTQAEIARRLGVHRSTISRCLPDVPGVVYEDEDGGRLHIDHGASLVDVHLSLQEALALHLATRLLAARMDLQNPHSASAVRKLGFALDRLAPRISLHMLQSADEMDDSAKRQDAHTLQTLEDLTQAWADLRKVTLTYRADSGALHTYQFGVFFIEPYAIGQSIYVIGWSDPPGALRTFKINRIERLEMGEDHYAIPTDFSPTHLLADAWGIWYNDLPPQQVTLRFSPHVARRVHETRWHRSEVVEDLPDGGVLWKARIAAPQEMMPWIRGWGAEVEVLEPPAMREEILREIEGLKKLYLPPAGQ